MILLLVLIGIVTLYPLWIWIEKRSFNRFMKELEKDYDKINKDVK